MRKLILILFLLINITLNATKYYVSPTGTDGAYPTRGTLANPWRTWHYAFNNTTPGDTCYFRGGVYTDMYNASLGAQLNTDTRNGTHNNPTCYFNYPNEYPVLSCESLTGQYKSGIQIAQASHIYVKGLTVRNVFQESYNTQVRAFMIHNNYNEPADNVNDITIENCIVHNASGMGFYVTSCDSVSFINCDAYNCCDTASTLTGYDPGGWGTGFGLYSINSSSYIYLYGCRAWDCSDQGYATNIKGYIEFDHCWSIHNGFHWFEVSTAPKGSGWKTEVDLVSYKNTDILQVYIHNCLAVDNEIQGFNTNDGEGDPEFRAHWYNNFSYRNGHTHYNDTRWGLGYVDFARNPSDTVGLWDHLYSNNLSYNNWGATNSAVKIYPGDYLQAGCMNYDRSYTNFWDVAGTSVNDLDFQSLDTTGLTGNRTRQASGALPATFFGKLSSTSNLIDAGTDVGIDYEGAAPDVGYAEYGASGVEPLVVFTTGAYPTKTTCNVAGNVYDDGGGTVSARGVVWAETEDPDLGDNVVTTGSGTGVYISQITGLSQGTTYHVRAYATSEAGTYYGADLEFTTQKSGYVEYTKKMVYKNGKLTIH